MAHAGARHADQEAAENLSATASLFRIFSWFTVASVIVYCLNIYLCYWQDWPGVIALFSGDTMSVLAILQSASYAACLVWAIVFAQRRADLPLRADGETITHIVTFLIRWAFWIVLLIGFVDAIISFLRVEGLLATLLGSDLESDLGRSQFRGPYVHMPLIVVALVIAATTRGLGFIWLGLLVAAAELSIVFSRFIFSYEQAFQGDLVRFWYAALFLFASAYTLTEEGHVRVDVFYAGFSEQKRGQVNFVGTLIMGIVFCWVILVLGTWTKSAVIVSPFMSYEVSQSGFGMYVKYLMATFLGVFAVSMIIQFAGYLLEALADWRGDPGHKAHAESMH
jgi:TRAP-type mannitol/chloroaromatic compound transport system permease small subunit